VREEVLCEIMGSSILFPVSGFRKSLSISLVIAIIHVLINNIPGDSAANEIHYHKKNKWVIGDNADIPGIIEQD